MCSLSQGSSSTETHSPSSKQWKACPTWHPSKELSFRRTWSIRCRCRELCRSSPEDWDVCVARAPQAETSHGRKLTNFYSTSLARRSRLDAPGFIFCLLRSARKALTRVPTAFPPQLKPRIASWLLRCKPKRQISRHSVCGAHSYAIPHGMTLPTFHCSLSESPKS